MISTNESKALLYLSLSVVGGTLGGLRQLSTETATDLRPLLRAEQWSSR